MDLECPSPFAVVQQDLAYWLHLLYHVRISGAIGRFTKSLLTKEEKRKFLEREGVPRRGHQWG